MGKKEIDLAKLSEEELMNLRVCDLPLSLDNSWLNSCVARLYREFDHKGIRFKPPCYLADEWLTPDGEPVIGIPFFLAHPVLVKLERRMMLDVEGGTRAWCMRLLRHEAGHALNYAYKLYTRRRWKRIFGEFNKEYADTYRFRPYSRSFVRHLEDYYAQYHPDEDFAETFAVWLTPELDWQTHYKGWKALAKLKYVDALMQEIKTKEPKVKKGKRYWEASKVRSTLKNYYKKKRVAYAEDFPDFHDTNLKRIFPHIKRHKNDVKICDILKQYKKNIVESVSCWTGEKKYIINDLLETLIGRSRSLKLVSREPETVIMLKIATYIATSMMNYTYTGRFRGSR